MQLIHEHEHTAEIRTNSLQILWGLSATLGTLIVSTILLYQGLKFESSYSLIYIAVSMVGIPFGLITFLWGAAGFFSKNKVILILHKRQSLGSAVKRKKTVSLNEIKDIRLDRHRFSLKGIIYEDIIVLTKSGKRKRIPTYNLLSPVLFDQLVREYILEFMDDMDQKEWLKNNKGFHFSANGKSIN